MATAWVWHADCGALAGMPKYGMSVGKSNMHQSSVCNPCNSFEHNYGYEKCNLLTKMFGTNEYIEKGLEMREKRRITPK